MAGATGWSSGRSAYVSHAAIAFSRHNRHWKMDMFRRHVRIPWALTAYALPGVRRAWNMQRDDRCWVVATVRTRDPPFHRNEWNVASRNNAPTSQMEMWVSLRHEKDREPSGQTVCWGGCA